MNARRQAVKPLVALMTAVQGRDATKIRELLEAGVDPLGTYKGICAADAALGSGKEALVRLFVEAFRRNPVPTSVHNLHITACRVIADDQYSASFAAEYVQDLRIEVFQAQLPCADMQRLWSALLLHGEANFAEYQPGPRDAATLADKVRMAIELGWKPATAWTSGWLPHHTYLACGFIEAALICIDAGADPDMPLYDFGNRSPDQFSAWPAFQAALRAGRSTQTQTAFSSHTRTRQRA